MADEIKSYIGSNINVEGWACTKDSTDINGERTIEYQGATANYNAALTAINATIKVYTERTSTEDPTTGITTISIVRSANLDQDDSQPDAPTVPIDEYQMPTVSIQGAMVQAQLHENPVFASLTPQDFRTVEWCLKNNGTVTIGDLGLEADDASALAIYARWRVWGVDTYSVPVYNMTITHFLTTKKKASVNSYYREPSKVYSFNDATSTLPPLIKPQRVQIGATEVDAWFANAPSIQYTRDGITVSQTFVGALKYPSFYSGALTAEGSQYYTPSALTDSNVAAKDSSSGTETSSTEEE